MGISPTERILKVLQEMPKGTHLCHFYQTPQDMLDVLVPYFAAGLSNNERCLWVLDGALTAGQAKEAMAAAVPDWEDHLEAGNIEFFQHTDWYVIDGKFDEERVLRQFLEKEAEAIEKGFRGLRISGNTLWARSGLWGDLLEYERHVDHCFCKHNMTAICTYALDRCSAADIVDVAKAHELVIIRRGGVWEIMESATLRHMREELRESHARLKTLAQQMVQVEQQERRRISKALHDGLQQTIVGTQLNLARAKNKTGPAQEEAFALIAELLDEALHACRTLTTEISPPILHERGLLPALEWLGSWFEKQHRLKVHFHLPKDEPLIGDSERVTLFEVARELLFNVVKHAGVRDAGLCVRLAADKVELVVRDEGKGCSSAAAEKGGGAGQFGLFSICERLRMMNGDCVFESTPGKGSECAVFLPLSLIESVDEENCAYADSRTVGELSASATVVS